MCFGLISGPGEVHVALSFVPFHGPGPSVSETDGQGMCLYMFRGQTRPTQQGSSSHQQLTSTSSSGHVQRHNPSLLSFPLNWHKVSDMTIAHRPQLSLESNRNVFDLHASSVYKHLCIVVSWGDFSHHYFHYRFSNESLSLFR